MHVIDVDERVDPNILEFVGAQEARDAPADQRIDSVRPGVAQKRANHGVPCGQRGITQNHPPIRFVESNDTPRPHQRRHLGDDILRLRDVDEDQARGRQVERCTREPGCLAVPVVNLDVRQSPLGDEAPRELDRVLAHLDTDHRTRRTYAIGEELETPLRTASDLDDVGARRNRDLLEEPSGLVGQLARLLLQTLLLDHAVDGSGERYGISVAALRKPLRREPIAFVMRTP